MSAHRKFFFISTFSADAFHAHLFFCFRLCPILVGFWNLILASRKIIGRRTRNRAKGLHGLGFVERPSPAAFSATCMKIFKTWTISKRIPNNTPRLFLLDV
jgi:hypothetical protein